MKRKLTPMEIKYGIITAGKGLKLSLDTDIDILYDSNLYRAHTHKTQEGRIGRLTEFFKDGGFQVGDTIEIFPDIDNELVVIQRTTDQESVEVTAEPDDVTDDSQTIVHKEDSPKQQDFDDYISNRKEIPFTEIKTVWLQREYYKYQGNQHERYVVNCEGTTGFKFEVTPYTEQVVTAWFWNGFLWMVCDYEGAYRLCKIKDNGRKIVDVCTLKQKKEWSSAKCRLYIFQDNSMLIQMDKSLHFISEKINKEIYFNDGGVTDSLIYIGRVDGSCQEDDWMFLWRDDHQDRITWAYQRGKRVKAIDIMNKEQRNTVTSIVKREIKNSYPEYYKSDLAKEMSVLFLPESRLFEIVFWRIYGEVCDFFGSDSEGVSVPKERCFYLSEDGTHLYYADKETEIHVENLIIEDENTVMPDYVKEITKTLYIYYTVEACRVGDVGKKPSLKKIEKDVLAWYDDLFQEGEGDAAFYLTLRKDAYKEKRYFVCKGKDQNSNECIYYAATKDMLHTESAGALKIDNRFRYVINTDTFLSKADIYFKSVADVLTGYVQLNRFKQGDPEPSKYSVKASELVDNIYGVLSYKKEQYLIFFADLSKYGFAKREQVKSNLITGEVYIFNNGQYELLPKAQLPDPQVIAHVVPTKEMKEYVNSEAQLRVTDRKDSHKKGHEIRYYGEHGFHAEDYIYSDISIYLQYDGGWVEHPVFRHLKACVLLHNGIIYANDAGVSFTHVSGRNYRISDDKNVVDMKVSGKTLEINLFEKLTGPDTRSYLMLDLYDVTENYYGIITNSRKISIEGIYNL